MFCVYDLAAATKNGGNFSLPPSMVQWKWNVSNKSVSFRLVMLHWTIVAKRTDSNVVAKSKKPLLQHLSTAHDAPTAQLECTCELFQVTTWGESFCLTRNRLWLRRQHGSTTRALPRFLDDFLRHHTTQESAQPRQNARCHACWHCRKIATPKSKQIAHYPPSLVL